MRADRGRFPAVGSKVIKSSDNSPDRVLQCTLLRSVPGNTTERWWYKLTRRESRGCIKVGPKCSSFKDDLTHWNIFWNFCEVMNKCITVHRSSKRYSICMQDRQKRFNKDITGEFWNVVLWTVHSGQCITARSVWSRLQLKSIQSDQFGGTTAVFEFCHGYNGLTQ